MMFGCIFGIAAFCLFAVLSCTLPVACLLVHTTADTESRPLEVALSSFYGVLLVALLWLLPSVRRYKAISSLLDPLVHKIRQDCTGVFNRPGDCLSEGSLYLQSIKTGYRGWLVGCQVQAGLVQRFGTGIPEIIHRLHRNRHTDDGPGPVHGHVTGCDGLGNLST